PRVGGAVPPHGRPAPARLHVLRDAMSWVTDFRELEPVVQRAPSAHNTQPWTLTYGTDHIDVGWDPAASLPVSAPTRRDLFLGLGAFVETCLVAAADTGLHVAAEGLRLV